MQEAPKIGQEIMTDEEKSMVFVEKHRDFFENYVKGKIKFAPAPKGLDTFAFDLKTNTIYVSTRFLEDRGLTFKDEATIFAVLHECEHFLEKIQVLSEDDGDVFLEEYLGKIKDRAYDLLDNCVADMRENTAVVGNITNFSSLVPLIYKENLWKDTDFSKEPLHIQLISALSREFQVKNEECQVSDEVREEINNIRKIRSKNGISVIDIMANPNLPMRKRVFIQDSYIWPVVEKLRQKDIENKNNQNKNNEGDGESGEGGSDTEDKEGNSDGNKSQKQKEGKENKSGDGKPKETDPNIIFKDDYDKAEKEGMPKTISPDDLKKIFKDWQKENGKEAKKEKALKEYAEKIEVKPEDLKTYRDIQQRLESAVNKETGESIKDELISLIERIISNRKSPKQKPRYPLEEGDILVDPVEAVVQVSSGNLTPAVWADIETFEKRDKMFGEIEITLVCDRSGSMNNPVNKLIEQRKSLVFLLEAVKAFNKSLEEKKFDIVKPLKVKVEGYSFQKSEDDKKPFLEMTDYLDDKKCIDSMVKVSSVGDSTTDFVTLESIRSKLTEETKDKIKEGELKKIVIVFTDGGSDDKTKVSDELKLLRGYGVIVIGVGVTKSGSPAIDTYAPNAKLAETAEGLVSVLFELLKEHLKGV